LDEEERWLRRWEEIYIYIKQEALARGKGWALLGEHVSGGGGVVVVVVVKINLGVMVLCGWT
jgi:hypothetical protein